MALVATQNIIRAGLEASYTAVAASHTFTNDGSRTFIHVVNGGTGMNCTIVTSATVDGKAVADEVVAIGSSEEHFIGPWPSAWYGKTTTVEFSETSDGTIAVLAVPAE